VEREKGREVRNGREVGREGKKVEDGDVKKRK
jgi:hypothetical protein